MHLRNQLTRFDGRECGLDGRIANFNIYIMHQAGENEAKICYLGSSNDIMPRNAV